MMYLTCNFSGNVHAVMTYVNTLKCAAYLFQVVYLPSNACILIFQVMSREDRVWVRKELGLRAEPNE